MLLRNKREQQRTQAARAHCTGRRVLRKLRRDVNVAQNACPVHIVATSAPAVAQRSTHRRIPRVPAAQIEIDGAARRVQRVAHLGVLRPSHVRRVVRVAAVLLQEINAKCRVRVGVKLLVPKRPGPSAARLRPTVRVDAELEARRVRVVGQRLDAAGELRRVGHQHAVFVAGGEDAVVEVADGA